MDAVNEALGRVTESRVGKNASVGDALARWGSTPAAPLPGASWFQRFSYHPAALSNGLATDREWYALRFTALLVRGFCDLDVVRTALEGEEIHPVSAVRAGGGAPQAMATLWLNKIHDSVCGTYHEVVLSFDVNHTKRDAIAFRAGGLVGEPWALQYANFGPSQCDSQYLHSLWIDSPLSIMWGREMQGFPKHPKPVRSEIVDGADAFTFDLSWDGKNVMRGRAKKRFGVGPFLRESVGLMTANNPIGVTRFLASPSFDVPITMPKKTAAQNGVGRRYVGHLWKGLSPTAVQVWPWRADDGDALELGDFSLPTGCEDHNGHALLARAKFTPVALSYLANAAAIVEATSG